MRACVCVCVCVCVIVHWHCSAQLSMFNKEKRYRNKIIIIIIIISDTERWNWRLFSVLQSHCAGTVSNTYAQVVRAQSCANHVQHMGRLLREICVGRASNRYVLAVF